MSTSSPNPQPHTEDIEQLFRTHYKEMYRLAYTLLRQPEESRDVVQNVFLQLVERHVEVLPNSARSYLLTATRNGCLNLMAQRQREDRLRMLYPREPSAPPIPVDEQEQRWKAIDRFIDEDLTPQTARALRLCYGRDMSYREAAQEMGISVSAVNKHLVQALSKLREHFNRKPL